MNKKGFLLGVVLLMAGQLLTAQEWKIITLSADGSEATYALTNVQKIVFEENDDVATMTVKMKSGGDLSGVSSVSFAFGQVGVEYLKPESSVFVYPNPVKTNLTVAGTDKNARINLLNLNGALLQSIITQDNTTEIDVSSLQQGLYLLQVGNQTVKFIKQ